MDPGIIIPVLAIGGFFASIITFTYMFFSSRHRERMALIDSGQDASIFSNQFLNNKENLKYGIVAVMGGLGLVIGDFLQNIGLEEFVAYFSMVLIFGGAGLIMFYFIAQGKQKEGISDQV